MASVALKARKHLSADALFHLVRGGFAHIPDPRDEDVDISLTDTLMSAFAMFSLKAPSLLGGRYGSCFLLRKRHLRHQTAGPSASGGP